MKSECTNCCDRRTRKVLRGRYYYCENTEACAKRRAAWYQRIWTRS